MYGWFHSAIDCSQSPREAKKMGSCQAWRFLHYMRLQLLMLPSVNKVTTLAISLIFNNIHCIQIGISLKTPSSYVLPFKFRDSEKALMITDNPLGRNAAFPAVGFRMYVIRLILGSALN